MIIELVGGQFVNQGAALMLRAVIDRVRESIPDAAFALSPGPWAPATDRRRAGLLLKFPLRKRSFDLNRLSYGWPAAVYDSLARLDLVVEGAAAAALDLSGYAYGDPWGELPLKVLTGRLRRAHNRARPYVFLPQTFGPFRACGHAARKFGEALATASYLASRDDPSVAAIQSICGERTRVERVPDLTIGYPGDRQAADRAGVDRRTALIIPNIRMLDSSAAASGWQGGYRSVLMQLAEKARTAGFVPRVLNHSGREDRELAQSLTRLPVIEELDPVCTKGIIGAAGLVISSRYHGCVSALCQGVPCLATSWSHKYQELFNDFGQREFVVMTPDVESAVAHLNALIEQRDEISQALIHSAQVQVQKVDSMWRDVLAILHRSEGP